MELVRARGMLLAAVAIPLLIMNISVVLAEESEKGISDVRLDQPSFNPAQGGSVTIKYKLAKSEKVTVSIYDPDGGLITTLLKKAQQKAGSQQLTWNGRDDTDQPVPDEAYTFTIETSSGAVYDPTTFSGGAVADITNAIFGSDGTVVYKLPQPGRVLSRLGVTNGPMLKTLVDWKPRTAGEVTEFWDGRDEDKLVSLRDNPGFASLITFVTLPEATVIAYGNREATYRDYKLGRGGVEVDKPERPRKPSEEVRLAPEHLVPPAWARAPQVTMSFPEVKGHETKGVPVVGDVVNVRVEVDASDKDYLLQNQFEVIFYIDNVFYAEAERGYLPLNWRWELPQVPPGEHILTVNISSFTGQVGIASRKIKISRKNNNS